MVAVRRMNKHNEMRQQAGCNCFTRAGLERFLGEQAKELPEGKALLKWFQQSVFPELDAGADGSSSSSSGASSSSSSAASGHRHRD